MTSPHEDTDRNTKSSFKVLALATGLVKSQRYVKEYTQVAHRVQEGIDGLEAMLGKEVDEVLTRGSYHLEEALDGVLETDVNSAYFNWATFLNDTETVENGTTVVEGVRQEGDHKVDLSDGGNNVDWSKVSEDRKSRAKAKAGAKMNHFLFDESYDEYPQVDAVITLNCGSHRGLGEIRDARGSNVYVNGKAGHVKQTIDINVQDQILYSRYMIDQGMDTDDLHESQITELQEHLNDGELRRHGIPTSSKGSVQSQTGEQRGVSAD